MVSSHLHVILVLGIKIGDIVFMKYIVKGFSLKPD